MQASIYRFYRNQRNVYKAECIINKKAVTHNQNIAQDFIDLQKESQEEYT